MTTSRLLTVPVLLPRAAALGIIAALALAACSFGGASPEETTPVPTDVVAEPVTTPSPTPEPTPEPTPTATADPDPSSTPVLTPSIPAATPLPEGITLLVSQGEVAPECTHQVCHYVHLQWSGLTVGKHQVACVSDANGVGVFSDNEYRFATEEGERDFKCFVAHPGSHVWVVVDGTLESDHADWPAEP